MFQNASELWLEDLPEVKPHLIAKINRAGMESVFEFWFLQLNFMQDEGR
jgi:hypothetical protein